MIKFIEVFIISNGNSKFIYLAGLYPYFILKYEENLLNNNIGTFAVAGLVDAVSYLLCLLFI